MPSEVRKAFKILRSDGLIPLVRKGVPFVHDNYISSHLPRAVVQYNGVAVKAGRLFDTSLPWREGHRPQFESGLISAISRHVSSGDDVVIVGGGWGVTAVAAAKQVGDSGSVTVFEGAKREVKRVKETVALNSVSDIVEVHHAIVGPEIHLKSAAGDPARVPPDQLPRCDVLELDCEGSEIDILKNLSSRPEYVFVETHGIYEAPTDEVRKVLEELDYEITHCEIGAEDYRTDCEEYDIYVLTGQRI
ncbi:hypothetical protein C2R22_21410 (plasmid) [Salinigranum rubrum]|uniref:Methyltransferase FkbM domain-containing protein n=1 Tax=Salinigranum rubrum TaxID=755307 RepID=A0A2I8VQE1_9EURY|nr:hypothetical protein C2R22_21410 [Salinigranum rubrum]